MGVINVDTRDRKPIYEQLIDNIKSLVLHGILKPGEQLPGVRTLAVELAINPNTIQKSYAELERQGIIYTLQGRGSFVSDNVGELSRLQREKSLAQLQLSLEAARDAGVGKNGILELIDKVWR
ncbi:MAG: GntR family transcriptional regulator [Clostridia bacterium]|nr:GntR family transcriptional regulator [Clostridia bacterium]